MSLKKPGLLALLVATVALLTPTAAWACACGCGIFDLGQPGLPNTIYSTKFTLQWSFMDQNETQHGGNLVSGALNTDKLIKTDFYNLDVEHMFNRRRGHHGNDPVLAQRLRDRQ